MKVVRPPDEVELHQLLLLEKQNSEARPRPLLKKQVTLFLTRTTWGWKGKQEQQDWVMECHHLPQAQ